MRIGLTYNGFYPIGELVEIARAADDTPVEGIWLAEHLGYRDAFVPAAAILGATRRLTVAPTAASPYARNAMLTAMQAASLAEIAPGRVALGLGTGSPMAFAESGMSQEHPVTAMREYIGLIRALWSGERVFSEGRMHSMRGATFQVPVAPPPPIEVAAMRERMTTLAGELGDAVVTSAGLVPEAIRHTVTQARAAAARAGRPAEAVRGVGFVIFAIARSHSEAVEDARLKLAYLFRNGFVAERLRGSGLDLDGEALARAASRRDWDTAKRLVSDGVVEACSICGTPAECRGQVERYAHTGLDVLVLTFSGGARVGHLALEMVRNL